jgi:hypothetical protein
MHPGPRLIPIRCPFHNNGHRSPRRDQIALSASVTAVPVALPIGRSSSRTEHCQISGPTP